MPTLADYEAMPPDQKCRAFQNDEIAWEVVARDPQALALFNGEYRDKPRADRPEVVLGRTMTAAQCPMPPRPTGNYYL